MVRCGFARRVVGRDGAVQLVDNCTGFVVSTLFEEPALWDQGIRRVDVDVRDSLRNLTGEQGRNCVPTRRRNAGMSYTRASHEQVL